MKIVHLTSVHPRYDTRIFLKECRSLANNGYEVSLVVADGKVDEKTDGIFIYDVGQDTNRFKRMLHTTKRVFQKALSLDADLYHLHDPELIPAGLRLKREGKKVIFDSHEDVPLQIRSKPYLNNTSRWFISKLFGFYESINISRFDMIVTATPAIRDRFLKINPQVIDINNYPLTNELSKDRMDWSIKLNQVCFVGGITSIRGIKQLVDAMSNVKSETRLMLAGKFSESIFEKEVKSLPGWTAVNELGFLKRQSLKELLAVSMAGLVTFLPIPNHINAQPNKMFEYMSAGIPVIASDFPLWKEIIEKNNCGICVNPLNPVAIAEAIDFIVTHPEEARQMGINGRRAVETKYNWEIEEQKLLDLYSKLLNQKV